MKGRETRALRGARPGVQVRRAVRQSDGLARIENGSPDVRAAVRSRACALVAGMYHVDPVTHVVAVWAGRRRPSQ